MSNFIPGKTRILATANEALTVQPGGKKKPYLALLDSRPYLMRLTHEVPVTLPVKKYLEHWMPAPYEATNSDFLGMWIINAMTRKTVQVKVMNLGEMRKKGYVYSWTYTIPGKHDERLLMPRRRAYELNAIIRKMMYLELISDIEALRLRGQEFYMQKALNDFRDRYGLLEKDLPDDRLRRMYQRFRERNNTLRGEMAEFWPGMLLGKIDLKGTKIYREN